MNAPANHASAAGCLPDLTPYLAQLDQHGYAVVPPEVTGVSAAMIDELVQQLLDKSEELIGCKFSVEEGPERPLGYGDFRGFLERISGAEPSQFPLMQLCTYHRVFRDLAVNPVATALIDYLFGAGGEAAQDDLYKIGAAARSSPAASARTTAS